MQIAFLTLFLGLVSGQQSVTLEAGEEVAEIALELDGRPAGSITHPPWSAEVNFGPPLLPHHLVARGLGAGGNEIASAEQWINLPRPPAEAQILLDGGGVGQKIKARVVWSSLTGEQPAEIHLALDGEPIALDREGSALVTVPGAGSAHVLSAELRFAGGVEARKDMALTGEWGDNAAGELTAVPLRTRKPGASVTRQALQGRLLAAGKPLEVVAVEHEPPHVFLVRAPGFEKAFASLLHGRYPPGRHRPPVAGFTADSKIVFHLVRPIARMLESTGSEAEIFNIGSGASSGSAAFEDLLWATHFMTSVKGPLRLADAVAVAGKHALSHQAPRAVVLLLGATTAADSARFDPATVRAYLHALGVPLFTWSIDEAAHGHNPRWGEIVDIRTPAGLHRAYSELAEELKTQQIVWVRGRWLPQSIALSSPAAGPGRDLALISGSAAAASSP